MKGLYAIIDLGTLDALDADPVLFSQAVLAAKPAALQLRAKDSSARRVLSLLRELLPLCRAAGVPLIVNDRPDYAALAGCDLVHIGQTDMPTNRARTVAPSVGVGVSTHDTAQLDRAISDRPSYVAFGPVFATQSKANHDPVVGLDGLRAAYERAQAAGVPLVAIGGIHAGCIGDVAPLADAVAMIGGLVPPGSPADAGWYDAVSHGALSVVQAIAAAKPFAP